MKIPDQFHERIRNIDVNCHKVECDYGCWQAQFKDKPEIRHRIDVAERYLTRQFGRSELLDFYKNIEVEIETKFLAAMIWGHEAPVGSRRDTRGPWKVSKMFSNLNETIGVLQRTLVDTEANLKNSYKQLNKSIERCGPNFFTKHLYFLGKSQDRKRYPLIFDDRVAMGLLKLSLPSQSCINMITVHAKAKADAYFEYLKFAHEEAAEIGCQPDQIEYFLFEL